MTVLFIHSTGTGPFMWDTIPDEVVPSSARLSPPNLGYPPLEPIARGTRVGVNEDVTHLLSQVPADATNLDVVAHSYGGMIALKATRALGARVRSLFLLEPVLFGALARDEAVSSEASTQAREFQSHPWFLTDDEKGGTEPWLELFIDYWNRPGSWQRLPELMRHHNLSMGWKMFNEVRSVFFDAGHFDDYRFPSVPMTLLRGERSPVGSREMVAALARRNPHAQVVELPGTGHMAPLTHPQKVADALAAHLARG